MKERQKHVAFGLVGPAVTRFTAGDKVFRVNVRRLSARAEFVCLRDGA